MRSFLLLLMLSVGLSVQAESVPSISNIDIELDPKQELPLSNKIRFQLHSTKSDELAKVLLEWNNITVKQSENEVLTVSIVGQTNFLGDVRAKHSTDSFVIDYHEKSIKDVTAAFTQSKTQVTNVQQIEQFVHEYITEPTYINGFHIASVVASQRSGDCTEYAVLSAALARSIGIPSRVVLGTVIVESLDQVKAVGHAWTEVWLNEQWQILDSALYSAQYRQRFYLPAAELENEGPGFGLSLFNAITHFPENISHLRDL